MFTLAALSILCYMAVEFKIMGENKRDKMGQEKKSTMENTSEARGGQLMQFCFSNSNCICCVKRKWKNVNVTTTFLAVQCERYWYTGNNS